MAAFADSGIYLSFGRKPQGNREPLLWPVLVHRVLYPDPKRAQLNIFQRAVLGLVRAHVVRDEEMVALTGLHLDLIKLILAQGVGNGWLVDSADALTEKGERLLDDEDISESDMKTGYLFQDALTGRFWPRLVARLQQIEPLDPMARFPEFNLNRKTGKSTKPFSLAPLRSALPPLDPESLMRAYKDYRDDYRAHQQLGYSSEFAEEVCIQGVQRLDDVAQPASVLVWVVADTVGAELWSIKDPFELRETAWWLQEPLAAQLERDANLLSRLASLIGDSNPEQHNYEQWRDAVHKQVEIQVMIEYSWVDRQPDIQRHLSALLVRRKRLEDGDIEPSELDAALVECQKLLEVVVQWLIRSYPADIGQLPKQRRPDFSLNEKLLSALEVPAFTKPIIGVLARQNLDQVIRACSKPKSSLKALLFAAAMGTLAVPGHPLRKLNSDDLRLDRLIELADLRNKSSHAQSEFTGTVVPQITTRKVLDSIQYALDFTSCFKEWM